MRERAGYFVNSIFNEINMNFENYKHVFSRLLDIWKDINPGNVDASIIVNQQKVHDRMAYAAEKMID